MNAFRHGMDSQHLQQATSNPNIQRVLQKQVSLNHQKRMSVASSNYNPEVQQAVASHMQQHQQPQSLPPQLQQPQQHPQPQQQQVSFPLKQQPGMHVAPPGAPPIPPYGLQPIPQVPAARISIPEQSSYSHTETAV